MSTDAIPALSDALAPDTPNDDGPFVVDNDRKAEWAMRRLAELHSRLVAHEAEVDWYLARITEWLAGVRRILGSDIDYFEGLLVDYMRRLRETTTATLGPKKAVKTRKLPSGELRSLGPSPGRITVVDADAFVEWAKHNGRTDLCTMTPSASAIRDAATMAGVVVADDDSRPVDLLIGMPMPGIVFTPGQVTYKAAPYPVSQPGRTLDPTSPPPPPEVTE